MKINKTIRLSKLDTYILNQLVTFFIFSVSLFASVGVAIGTVSDLTYKINEYNLPIDIAVKIFLLKIPEYLAYALPIGILLTTLIVYSRFHSDQELIAFQSVGISIYRLIIPAIALSFAITGITFILNELVVPAANYQTTLLQHPFIRETQFDLQRKDIFYPEYQSPISDNRQLKRLYYAEKFDGEKLNNIAIMTWYEDKLTQIITAKSARWNSQKEVWELRQGKEEKLSDSLPDTKVTEFLYQELSLPATFFKLVNTEKVPEDMNIIQAQKYLKIIAHSGNTKQIRLLEVRIRQKMAFPSICVIFALIGATLGSSTMNINKSQSFGLCVAIVFLYYLLGFMLGSFGIAGLLSPFLAAWLPNFLGLGIGVLLLINNYSFLNFLSPLFSGKL